ncbi:hypothetical protein A3K93_06590 [Acinetobacter sp. NCu2D-2]|uniref:hypothetical protein n=1 Tax=Acinetobacter sp. NCu2D-2 TaxID=1608473 RepID=UPI0007CDF708|nr:hypothetical protein [Acinetobacter sp. NCu2D-2]ANF81891.1 hypothetical protein A3K93_06590 [Acinetobacter sp. NCu2D-2]
MQKIISVLKELSVQHDVKNYNWQIPESCPLAIPDHITSNFDRNIYLKENLHTMLKQGDCMSIYYWMIQEWGGIASFKRNDINDAKILKFIKELDKKSLTKISFERISSFSKVASFMKPAEYVIYDSRVIYALNWLLFNYAPAIELFPQPQGRNSELVKYDMQTILRLSGKQHAYRSHKKAYQKYCELMKGLSVEVYGQDSQPYLLEMLLFDIAPQHIVKDIENRVSLKIDLELKT